MSKNEEELCVRKRPYDGIGADTNAVDSNGVTGLMLASQNGHAGSYASSKAPNTLLELLRGGADVNGQDKRGETALHKGCRNGHKESVRVLLIAG